MCAAVGGARAEELSKLFGAQKILSESKILGTELQDWIYTTGIWFYFDPIVTVSCFCSLGVSYFFILQKSIVETLWSDGDFKKLKFYSMTCKVMLCFIL